MKYEYFLQGCFAEFQNRTPNTKDRMLEVYQHSRNILSFFRGWYGSVMQGWLRSLLSRWNFKFRMHRDVLVPKLQSVFKRITLKDLLSPISILFEYRQFIASSSVWKDFSLFFWNYFHLFIFYENFFYINQHQYYISLHMSWFFCLLTAKW